MAKSTIKDMTVGSPVKLILGFAVPLLFGLAFQQLYSFVDTAIVGKVLGATKLAAVGSTGALNFLILGLCNGMCSGMSIPIAQDFGAKEETELRRHVANAIYVCVVFSLLIAAITGLLCRNMLQLMATDASILDDAVSYIRVIFLAIPVTVLYNMASGILRSLGDSKTPVMFIALASVINIVLDLFFMLGLGMGVEGAAIATVISQLVSGVGCVIVMIRRFPILHLSEDDRKFRAPYAKHLVYVGIPMGLQFSITAIGSIIVQWAVNGISVAAVAAMTAAGKINMFFNCVFDALSTTMATYAGQNVGARNPRRVSQGMKATSVIGIIYCLISLAVVWFFGPLMLSIFLDSAKEQEIIAMAHMALKWYAAFYIPLLFVNVVRLTIQGMGYTNFAMLAGVMEMIARTLAALLLVPSLGFTGACLGNPLAWIFADAFLIPCYLYLIARMKKRFSAPAPSAANS